MSCGGVTRIDTRSKIVEEENGGVCVGEPTAEEACNTQDCPGKIVSYGRFKTTFNFYVEIT